MSVNSKIALVTGGTGGIGTAICRALNTQGYTVFGNYKAFDNSQKWLKAAETWEEEQLKAGYYIKAIEGDVSDFSSAQKMITAIKNEFGQVDILVNNAGILDDSALYKMSYEQWMNVINTNLNSVFICTRLVIEGMIAKGWGRVINISSVNAKRGQAGQSNYAAAKAGLYGFTKSLAAEVATRGITVNTISPGHIDTAMNASLKTEIKEKILSQIPLRRLGITEEIASAVIYLCSDSAQYMTGSDIPINGGLI